MIRYSLNLSAAVAQWYSTPLVRGRSSVQSTPAAPGNLLKSMFFNRGILCVGSLLAEQYANIALRLMENPWTSIPPRTSHERVLEHPSRRVVIHGVKLRRVCSFPRPALTLRFVLTIDLRIGRLVRIRMPHSRAFSHPGAACSHPGAACAPSQIATSWGTDQ